MSSRAPRATLLRHGRRARVAHALNALAVIVLIVTGLALGDLLPARAVTWLGGHVLVNATHRQLGLVLVLALLVLGALLWRRALALLREVVHLRGRDLHWLVGFVRFWLWPQRHPVPFHDGRFDPAQRMVFIGLLIALVLAAASGVYIYVAPPLGRMWLAWAIRTHIASAWALIACVSVHVVAGSGLLWTHRGLLRSMFADGRVEVTLARALWPGWAQRQAAGEGAATPTAALPAGRDPRDQRR